MNHSSTHVFELNIIYVSLSATSVKCSENSRGILPMDFLSQNIRTATNCICVKYFRDFHSFFVNLDVMCTTIHVFIVYVVLLNKL